jgi:hypothetical protein
MSKVTFLVHVHIITFNLFDLSFCPHQKLLSTFSEHTFPLLTVEWFFHAQLRALQIYNALYVIDTKASHGFSRC